LIVKPPWLDTFLLSGEVLRNRIIGNSGCLYKLLPKEKMPWEIGKSTICIAKSPTV
jgi:hypothetical protein